MTSPLEDEFTELVDANIPRVDLVDKAANGTTFLIAKAQGAPSLLSPDLVRDLIGKTAAEPEPEDEQVTMTGSPSAIAKLMHEAALRARQRDTVAKEKYDSEDRKRMAANGEAMDDGSYPIADHADLTDAVRAVGRGGADHDAIRRHVIARAKALGATSEIPDNWNADGSLKGDVAKEMDMDDDALDVMTALAETDGDHPGMDTDPGSPAWEAIDAATACKWTAVLARAQNAIAMLAEREMLEAAAGDEDDAEKAFDLQDACCAIDYAISVLAPFAVSEQAAADCCDDMQMVGKALHGFDTQPLDTIEALGSLMKAGRVLSSANEAAIRGAVDSLQNVLASLPTAPVEKTANEEDDMPQPTTSAETVQDAGGAPAMGTRQGDPKPVAGQPVTEMEKAGGEGKKAMVVVYDQNKRLIGIVDPDDITPVANSEADADDMEDAADGDSETETETDGDAAPETTDLTPEPPAEAGTPADAAPTEDDEAVSKATHPIDTNSDMTQSSFLELVKSALAEHATSTDAKIATTGDAVLALVGMVETLKGQVEALEQQPAEPRVFTNGAVPPRDQMRGQDRGAPSIDVAKAAELKRELYRGQDAGAQRDAATALNEMAIVKFREITGR